MSRLSPAERRQEDRADIVRAVSLSGAILGMCLLGAAAMALATSGCNLPVKTIVSDALSAEQLACVIAQQILGKEEPAVVAAACEVPPALIEQVASTILAAKKARAMAAKAAAK